jgi:K+-transporting ATPase KdpF subunit
VQSPEHESEGNAMIENTIILALSIALLAYLVYAMLRPEKF